MSTPTAANGSHHGSPQRTTRPLGERTLFRHPSTPARAPQRPRPVARRLPPGGQGRSPPARCGQPPPGALLGGLCSSAQARRPTASAWRPRLVGLGGMQAASGGGPCFGGPRSDARWAGAVMPGAVTTYALDVEAGFRGTVCAQSGGRTGGIPAPGAVIRGRVPPDGPWGAGPEAVPDRNRPRGAHRRAIPPPRAAPAWRQRGAGRPATASAPVTWRGGRTPPPPPGAAPAAPGPSRRPRPSRRTRPGTGPAPASGRRRGRARAR